MTAQAKKNVTATSSVGQQEVDVVVTHLLGGVLTGIGGASPWRLEDGALLDLMADLLIYIERNNPPEAIQLACLALARGAWITVDQKDEDRAGPVDRGGVTRSLLVDLFELADWIPANGAQPMLDGTAAADSSKPVNDAVRAVLQLLRQHPAPAANEDLDLQGTYAIWCKDDNQPVRRMVSLHRSMAGASRAAQRRNQMDPKTVYHVGLRYAPLASQAQDPGNWGLLPFQARPGCCPCCGIPLDSMPSTPEGDI